MKSLFLKLHSTGKSPARAPLKHILWAWLGSAIAIGATGAVAIVVETPFLFAPLGASAVLAFAVPDSPLAQPRNIVGGHIISAIVGLIFLILLGNGWWVLALGVATAIAAMLLTKTLHPPAGANPLIIIMASPEWQFIFYTILPGALILTLCAIIFNNFIKDRRYPTFWW